MLFKKNNSDKKTESEELFNNPYIIDDETSESAQISTNGKTPLLSQHSEDETSFDSSYEEAEEPHSSTSTHFDLDIASESLKEQNEEKESLLPNKSKKTSSQPRSTSPAHPLKSIEEDEISVLPSEIEQTNNTTNNNTQQTTEKVTISQDTTAKKTPVIVKGGNDGVFANLSAKPQINKPTSNDPPTIDAEMEDGPPSEPLPNYDQTMQEPSPPQFDNMTFIPMAADDVLVDHLPVGSIFAFLWSFIVTFMFEWVGFVLTYLLHINHSGRFGSFTGLGAILISKGIKFITDPDDFKPDGDSNNTNPSGDDGFMSPDKEKVITMVGYVMTIIGFMFLIKSLMGYHRVIKIRREMLANSPLPL